MGIVYTCVDLDLLLTCYLWLFFCRSIIMTLVSLLEKVYIMAPDRSLSCINESLKEGSIYLCSP